MLGLRQLRVSAASWRQRVLPRGAVNLMFPIEGTLTVTDRGGSQSVPVLRQGPFVSGLQSGAITSKADGALLMFGVSLRASTSRAVLPLPALELCDLTIPSADVIASSVDLFGRLHEASSFGERCGIVLA